MNRGLLFVAITLIVGVGGLFILATSRKDKPTSFERDLMTMAGQVGINEDEFLTKYRSSEVRDRVDNIIQAAKDRGVQSTPTIYINGSQVNPVTTYAEFDALLSPYIEEADGEKVVVEVYDDYTCPYCARFFPILLQAKAEFGADVLEINKNYFELNSASLARKYSYAAEVAKEYGKFDQYSRKIFERQHDVDYSILDTLGQ